MKLLASLSTLNLSIIWVTCWEWK